MQQQVFEEHVAELAELACEWLDVQERLLFIRYDQHLVAANLRDCDASQSWASGRAICRKSALVA
jgi:hypothetical protein